MNVAAGVLVGFLVAGLAWGLVADRTEVRVFFLVCVVVAGVYGAATGQPADPGGAGRSGVARARSRRSAPSGLS